MNIKLARLSFATPDLEGDFQTLVDQMEIAGYEITSTFNAPIDNQNPNPGVVIVFQKP